MTTDPKDAAGEKLRIAIAEKLGWKRETRKMYAGAKGVSGWGFNQHLSLGHPDRQFHTHPNYWPKWETDPAAALLLVEHMRKEGYVIRLDNGTDTTWEATFYDSAGPETNDSYSPAPTLPMAICLAFSKANQLDIQ